MAEGGLGKGDDDNHHRHKQAITDQSKAVVFIVHGFKTFGVRW